MMKAIVSLEYNNAVRMNKEQELQEFKQKFANFIKQYKCQQHNKAMNLTCIDAACPNKGLICSVCLTINGPHKNHDAVEIYQYVGNCLEDIGKEKSVDEVLDLLNRAEIVYEQLLTLLSRFMENCSKIITGFLSQRNDLHQQRKRQISSTSFIKKILSCNFSSLTEANKMLSLLSSKYSINQIKKPNISQQRSLEKAQDYVNDLTYEKSFIDKEFRRIEVRLKQILVVKEASPLVLNYEPTFHQPSLLQNNELVYIGESKDKRPHGKGICFYHSGDKIVYGDFQNGKVDGMAELYYGTGDYYLGQFKSDKKNGRGVYRWNGKQCNVYEGEFKSGRRHGKGTFWWSDGSKYVGSFCEGNQTGYGLLYRTGNQVQYEGYWLDGLFHGQGAQYFPNGEKFQGQFKQDKFHGQGILYKEKEIIRGKWRQNQLIETQINMGSD